MPAKKKSSASAPSTTSSGHAARLPVSSVTVVGCGGNGSIFVSHLCRIWNAWVALGGDPFEITLIDDDVVSEANLARQCFCADDVGRPKSVVLAQRASAFFGISIKAQATRYEGGYLNDADNAVVVGCVDNVATRKVIAKATKGRAYWLDLGNADHSGQVVLGGHGLPTVLDLYPDLIKSKDKKSAPSCSAAESLERQDLFINPLVATLAGNLLWKLMRTGRLTHHGYVINLNEGIALPIKV